MGNEKKELVKKNIDYHHHCRKDVLHVKEGIKITEDIWNKYVKHIEDLIVSNKIKDQVAKEIENRIEILNSHWQGFKAAWDFKLPNPKDMQEYDPFDPNPNQQYSLDKLIPKSTQKQEFDCFAKKITELHQAVQAFAYHSWFDRLYQFIKTSLLKLYNCLYAGPGNISGEKVYITAANYGQTVIMPRYVPMKHNYFICQEKLSHNTALLQDDLKRMENWQKSFPP